MPNSIKYSTTGDTQSLRDGNFYIGTGDVGKGPTSSTGHWNGITPTSGGYTVYKNKVSNGPAIWTATSDNQLISLTNNTEGTSFTTVQQCLNYYATQTDKMVFNRDYEGIVTSGLTVCLDAGFIPSYQGSGTTWYDISGSNNHFTLYNSLSYNPTSGGTFSFDGTNDYARSTSTLDLSAANAVTVQVIGNASNLGTLYEHSDNWNTNAGGFGLSTNSDGNNLVNQYMHYFWNTNGGTTRGARNFGPVEQSSYFFIETKVLVKNDSDGLRDYYNGNRVTYVSSPWGTGTTTVGNTTNFRNDYFYLGGRGGSSGFLQGNIAGILIYNRALSASEILQNYNASVARFNTSNIVKNDLVINLDASNSVSYPTSGTTWTDLSGNGNKGTLTNGPTFDSTSKSIVFDGVDDFMQANINSKVLDGDPSFTVDMFVKRNQGTNIGPNYGFWGIGGAGQGNSVQGWTPTQNLIHLDVYDSTRLATSEYYPENQYIHLVWTKNGPGQETTNVKCFINGVEKTLTKTRNATRTNQFNTSTNGVGVCLGRINGDSSSFYSPVTVDSFRVYSKALSPTEILQNYYQAPIVTSGLVIALDAGNLVSYSGAGTTWRDLTTDGNNGTLINGPAFNSSDGGSIVFDGTNDYVNIGVNKSCNRFTGDFAVSVWVNRTNAGVQWGNIIGDYFTNNTQNALEWQLMISNTAQLFVYNVTNGYVVNPIASGFNAGTWINVVLTRIGSTLSLYANSNFITSVTNTTTFGSATGNLNIGVDGNNSAEPLTGKIANVMIYKNKGLTLSEVSQNYNAQKSRFGL